jgi:hypothetical protein
VLEENSFAHLLRAISAASSGVAGVLAVWFDGIVQGSQKFSFRDFAMQAFVGATIGVFALGVGPWLGIKPELLMPFACAAASSHKYIFKVGDWFLRKWTSP